MLKTRERGRYWPWPCEVKINVFSRTGIASATLVFNRKLGSFHRQRRFQLQQFDSWNIFRRGSSDVNNQGDVLTRLPSSLPVMHYTLQSGLPTRARVYLTRLLSTR